MKRAIKTLGALAVLAGFFLAAPAAQAASETYGGITCTDYPVTSGVYPADGNHFKVCFNYIAQNAEQIKTTIQGLPAKAVPTDPDRVRDLLQARSYTIYYFQNRSAANAFFAAHPVYGGQGNGVFESTTARCGQTGAKVFFGQWTIATAIYDQCTYAGGQFPNPDRGRVTAHEAGHGFDLALTARAGSTTQRSRLPGFLTLGNHDRSTTLGSVATCTLFGSTTPSALERELGLPTIISSPVCSGPSTVNPPFVGKTNRQIAEGQFPYFFNPQGQGGSVPYSELWAEQFQILAKGVSGTTYLPVTDRTINLGATCSFWNVKAYWNTLEPVGPNNPNQGYRVWPAGCPNVPENQLE